MTFHNSHGVILCVVREQAAPIKQGVDFFSLHLPMRAYICSLTCFMHTHYSSSMHTQTHTHARGDQFQSLSACLRIVVILRSEQHKWWTCSDRVLVRACPSTGITLQQCLLMCARACVRVCVWLCLFKFIPFLLSNPIQGCRRKALANILIHCWLESNL